MYVPGPRSTSKILLANIISQALSKIYAGTGALKSSFTRHGKMSLAGAFADARKSATRLYVNNFTDKARQNTTDILLVWVDVFSAGYTTRLTGKRGDL